MKVGCDLVDLSRLPLENQAFLKGVLAPEELEIFQKRNDKREFLGGRFAAKEAYLKALGTGIRGRKLNSIKVLYDDNGAPYILDDGQTHAVSISHDGGYAYSVVIIA